MSTRFVIAGLLSGLLLSACSETSNPSLSPDTSSALRTGSKTDEKACLDAVAKQANNTVTIISSEFSEANTLVMVGVGPENAPWKCLVSKGVVAEASFAGDEGKL
jgi:ABC-type Fe3+-hydroxamate transport system substrate-binding protein